MSAPLPDPHMFITSVISQLANIDPPSVTGLSSLPRLDLESAKSIFTTLHFLFPHELLPALDLLDRKLLTQLVYIPSSATVQTAPAASSPQQKGSSTANEQTQWEVFYVQSASASVSFSKSNSRYRRAYNPAGTYYEVRLHAWNCTCPAFAYSAFGRVSDLSHDQAGSEDEHEHHHSAVGGEAETWRFGGTATRDQTGAPICKHILAAVLGKALPRLFGHGVERKVVTAAEVAGWGAGWGD
jgi:hypothetical protein